MRAVQTSRLLEHIVLPERVDTLRRSPQLGPKLLFFSGGTALRPLCRQLKRLTHNSIHLITPFDSGGSSSEIRRAFRMLSVGDLRSRLLALANESNPANRELYRLFCYRLSKQQRPEDLNKEVESLASGQHELVLALPSPLRRVVCDTLQFFVSVQPEDFKLQGANIGNLFLTGAYLSSERNFSMALMIFGTMLEVQGDVEPTTEADAQLAVRLQSGECIVGQHLITGKEVPPVASRIEELFLTGALNSVTPISVAASPHALNLISEADLICYPCGSFYSSVVANLLPEGVGRAIAQVPCPKLYIPNWGSDPEQIGMTLADTVQRLIATVRIDDPLAKVRDIVQRVLIDTQNLKYSLDLDLERVIQLGVEVLDVPFAQHSNGELNFQLLAETVVSLS